MAGRLADNTRYANRPDNEIGGKTSGYISEPLPEVVCNIHGHSYNHGISNRMEFSTVVAMPEEKRQRGTFAKRVLSLIQVNPNLVTPSLTPTIVGNEQTPEKSVLYLIVGIALWSRRWRNIDVSPWERSLVQSTLWRAAQ